MTARNTRLVGLAAAGALSVGLVGVPTTAATAGSSAGDDPGFYQVSAGSLPDGGSGARSTLAKVATSKNEQILQTFTGRANVGAAGIAVAAGPKDVMQVSPNGANIFVKSTGAASTKTLNKLFGVDVSITLTDPTVEYDPVGKRWIIAAISDDAGDIGLTVRVSKKTSPTKWFPAVPYATSGSTGEPSPNAEESDVRVGVTSDKVVLTAAATDTGDPTLANRILIIPKGSLYNNNKPDAWVSDLNNTYDGQSPAVNATKQANAFVSIPDTDDITVTTYTGKATGNAPTFSKSVMYPNTNLVTPPTVDQGGAGDDLDLGGLTFDSAWRGGKLYAAATTDCSGVACVQVFGINTNNGVSIMSQKILTATGRHWFTPSVSIDGASNVHLAATDVEDGAGDGPNLAVMARDAAKSSWTKARYVALAGEVYDGTGNPTGWVGGTAAALDPTASWDAWVTGGVGAVGGGLVSRVARVSLAKNVATLKASATKVAKGRKVTFTAKLARPGGDTIKGLPIALQKKSGGTWSTLSSKQTSAKGTAEWTKKIKKAAQYRTYGKAVKQVGGTGRAIDKVYSKALKISLK